MVNLFLQSLLTVIFASLGLALFGVYRNIFGGAVIFYEGLFSAIAIYFTIISCLFYYKKKIHETIFNASINSVIPAFLFYFLFIALVPTIIDRSVSITVLGKLYKNKNEKLSAKDLQSHFERIYVKNGKAVKIRLNEQIISGNIIKDENGYQITPRGIKTIQILDLLGRIYNIDLTYLRAIDENSIEESWRSGPK